MKMKISMKTQQNLSILQAYELFKKKAKVKNLSERTIQTYDRHMRSFCGFIGGEIPISQVTEDSVDDYILYLKNDTGIKDVSVASYMRTIRAFLYFCMDSNYVSRFKIRIPRFEKEIKPTYTDEELRRLLKKPDLKKTSFTEYRIWVFENYLLATGNRISSALNVKISDLNFEDSLIVLRRVKNRKQQIIPMSHSLSGILNEYLEVRGGTPEDYVFCNNYGEQGDIRTYQSQVREYNIQRNVSKTSCHLFRHTFAKKWIMAGGDIFRLQKILGHSDLTVTKEYVQMFGQDLQIDFEQFNPLDNMNVQKSKLKMCLK